MNNDSKWYFTSEQLLNSPSKRCGMDADTELMSRQRAANLIQDMGQRLQVSQLCINTAIVYMHRFYAFHSFTHFHRDSIAAAALFLAAKVEEQPRKLEHVIKVANISRNIETTDQTREVYTEQAQDLVFNENVLLQTLGFDVAIDHPHTHVVKTCHLVKASKDLAQTSYFMASNSLHLTTMCLQYKPTVVACFCIHLACLWSSWEIPQSTEGKHWFHYVDKSVTKELLKQLTDEFLHIFDKCPSRLKSKMKSIKQSAQAEDAPRKSSSTGASSSSSTSGSGVGYPQKEDNSLVPPSTKSSHHRSHHQSVSHHHSKNPTNLPSVPLSSKSSSSSSSSKYQQHGQPPSIVSNSQMNSSSTSNQRIKQERSSMGTGDLLGSSMYNKDGSSATSSTGYTANSSSFGKNPLLSNSFGSSKSTSNMPPIMSSASQKASGNQPPSDNLSTYGTSSASSSVNKMRQSSSSSQSQRQFPNQYDAVKQEKGSNFKGVHGMKTMSTEMMSTLLSAPKPQPVQQPPYSQSVQSNSYRHSQQQQQQQQQQKPNLSLDSDLAYKFIDEIKSESSPKLLSKPTSIFSPDWKEPVLSQQSQLPPPQPQSRVSSSIKMEAKGMDNKMSRGSTSGFNPSAGSSSNTGSLLYDRKPNPKRFNDLSTINMQQFTNIPMTDSSSLLNSRLSSKRPYVPDPSMTQPQQQQHQPPPPAPHHHNKYDTDNGGSDSRESKIRKTDYFSTTTLDTTTASSDSIARNNHDFKLEKTSSSTLKMPSASDLDTDSYSKPFSTQSSSSTSSLLNSSGRSIETNPDLVSTLLKESLCGSDSNKYGGVFGATLDDDGGKFSSKADSIVMGQIGGNGGGLLHDSAATTLVSGEDGNHRSKAEKKKKKDKHKHKERSKDKEERKKHKKDKERHKERDGAGGDVAHNDMNNQKLPKLTIPTKDLINFHGPTSGGGVMGGDGGVGATTGFKIKIPKDRIKPELQTNASSHNRLQQTTQPLKIKISKDMIESYSHPKFD